jgi:hypothetical protein
MEAQRRTVHATGCQRYLDSFRLRRLNRSQHRLADLIGLAGYRAINIED